MDHKKLAAAVLVGTMAVGALGPLGTAHARSEHKSATNEAAVIAGAKITMAQAIAAAENQVGGKAVETGIEDEHCIVAF